MSLPPTSAILLRRIEHGDFDLILTFLTSDRGKITVFAKSAKKSKKRFAGILELFAVLEIVYSGAGRRRGLPMLQEASLKQPFSGIRGNLLKTAYASYWAQLIAEWAEENVTEPDLFRLLLYSLAEMDQGRQTADALSILFQLRFLELAGLAPGLDRCCVCQTAVGDYRKNRMRFDLVRGGVICTTCRSSSPSVPPGRDTGQRSVVREAHATYQRMRGGIPGEQIFLSLGTIKPLLWIQNNDLKTAGRMRLTTRAAKESLTMLEAFVPYHLGKDPRSLKFLQQIRK